MSITKIETNLQTLTIHKLSQAQYDNEVANGTIDENALYLTPDNGTGADVDLSDYSTTTEIANTYETKEDAVAKLDEAKLYADEQINTALNGSFDLDHTHDDRYYTETEIDTKIATIDESIVNATNEMKSYADTANESTLEASKLYADEAVAQKSQVQIITWEADD